MRISDWSSDVCSSDLLIAHLAPILGHHLARHDAMIAEPRQPVRQNVARDAELLLELLEMMDAVERGAQDHERPSLAHRYEREPQGARASTHVVERFAKLFHRAHHAHARYQPDGNRVR